MNDESRNHEHVTTAASELAAAVQIANALAPLSPDARKRVLARVLQQSAVETPPAAARNDD